MKYIIFDLDGTLSRTDKFMIPSIELAMEKMNIPVWTEDAIRCTIGEPVEVTNLKFFGQKKSEEADNFWKLVSGYYRTVFHNSVEEYEGKDHFIVIVSEGYGNPVEIATQIQEKTGIDSRATILGHVQRGGNPTLKDRVNATRMGYYAVKLLEEGKTNRVVALQQGNLVDYDIQEALKMKKPLDMDLYNMMMEISF